MKDLYNLVLKSPHNHRFFRSIKIIYHIENNNNFRKIYKICKTNDTAVRIPFSRRINYYFTSKRPRTIKAVIKLFASQGYLDGIKMLDGNINIDNHYKGFFTAAAHGHCNVVKYFLKSGIDINYIDDNDQTVLTHAIYNGHYAVVKLLIAGGADVHYIDHDGWTYLHDAIFRTPRQLNIVQLLVNAGINFHLKTNINRTALDFAKRYQCRDDDDTEKIIQLLEKYIKI